jgi:hypothetical protein
VPDQEASSKELEAGTPHAEAEEPVSQRQVAEEDTTAAEEPAEPTSPLRIYPFEIAAWVGLILGVIFLRAKGLRIDWNTVRYTVPPLVPVMARFFVAGLGLYTLYAWIRERSPKAYLHRIVDWRWLLLSVRLWFAVIVFTYTYFCLKVCVPLVNFKLWDEAFWNLDILIHFGFSPSVFLLEVFTRSGLAPLLDLWYSWWLPSVSLSIAFFCAFPQDRMRRRFMLSCVLLWTIGAWLYVALPALGPIYVYNDVWSGAGEQLPHAAGAQQLLWDNYQTVLTGRTGDLRQFNPTRGVAAMPSLHVGAHWLLMLWFYRRARPFFVVAALGTFLTFIASVVTGWHYAVDGFVGILLAQAIYLLAIRWERPRTSPQDENSEATVTSQSQPDGRNVDHEVHAS